MLRREGKQSWEAPLPPQKTLCLAGCPHTLTLPTTAPRLCSGSHCRPQLLYGKPEVFRTSEVQVLFANMKNLPACWESQNNAPFVSQMNLQNKAYVFSFPLLFIKGKDYP